MSDLSCPVDGATLVPTEIHGSVVDQCPICRGIWCDRGELEAIVDRAARALAKLKRGQKNRKPFVITDENMRKPGLHRSCPDDGAGLVHRERHGVAVDLCPLCHGIWLDANELQAIINLTTEAILNMGPDVDIDTVSLPLASEPARQINATAAKMSQVISRKELLRYDQAGGNLQAKDVKIILDDLTAPVDQG